MRVHTKVPDDDSDLNARTSLPDDAEDITLLAGVHTGEIDCCTLQFLQ